MGANVALGVVIGGAVGASFGRALTESSAKIDAFKQKTEKARGFHNLIIPTCKSFKAHGFAERQLDKEYARLGRMVKGLELGQHGHEKMVQSKRTGRLVPLHLWRRWS